MDFLNWEESSDSKKPTVVEMLNAQTTSNARNQQMIRTSFHSTHYLFLMFTFILFRSIFSLIVYDCELWMFSVYCCYYFCLVSCTSAWILRILYIFFFFWFRLKTLLLAQFTNLYCIVYGIHHHEFFAYTMRTYECSNIHFPFQLHTLHTNW